MGEDLPPRGRGRPSPYEGRELEISTQICARLETGEPLAQILRENNMPSHWALLDWREKWPEIEHLFTRARLVGFDVIAADCLAIADDTSNDTIVTERGGEAANAEWIQRSKLRVETRLKLLAKWDPKRYGDTANTQTVNVGVALNVLTEDRRAELLAKKRGSIERRKQPKTITLDSNGT